MALLVDVVWGETVAKKAYVSIPNFLVGDDKHTMTFVATSRMAPGEVPFIRQGFEIPYDLDGLNPFIQAYAHLKTLPEFAGAEDC